MSIYARTLPDQHPVEMSSLREDLATVVASADCQPRNVGEWARWAVRSGNAFVVIADDGGAKIIAPCKSCNRRVAPLGICPECGGPIPKELRYVV